MCLGFAIGMVGHKIDVWINKELNVPTLLGRSRATQALAPLPCLPQTTGRGGGHGDPPYDIQQPETSSQYLFAACTMRDTKT